MDPASLAPHSLKKRSMDICHVIDDVKLLPHAIG